MGAAGVAGIVQGVTGFGGGIVLMMFLPYFYDLPHSAGLAGAICIILNLMMVTTYRKYIDFKKIVVPSLLYLTTCSITINYSTLFDQGLMKKVFGVFLLILCVYYLFFNKNTKQEKLSLPVSIFCIVVSAVCDGLFGIGGPLMVLYFMAQCKKTEEYLGTIQTFFLINCVYNTGFRVFKGILTTQHFIIIGLGMIAIVVGGLIANKIVKKLNSNIIRKLTYIMIGISGLLNIV